MRQKHIITRNNRHYFVCRVPQDLLPYFPCHTVWKSLHTSDKKAATVIAASYEYQAQQLFMQLRSRMLTPDLEKRLVASFLAHGAARIQAQATRSDIVNPTSVSPLDSMFADNEAAIHKGQLLALKVLKHGHTEEERAAIESDFWKAAHEFKQHDAENQRLGLIDKEPYFFDIDFIKERVKKDADIKISASEARALCLKLTDAQIQLDEAEAATYKGNWSHLRAIQQATESILKTPYESLAEVIEKYQEWYRSTKTSIAVGTLKDMEVECRTLHEITGNISIEAFNSMDTVTKVKKVLRKYPLNRQQRYGGKSLSAVLKLHEYDVISPKTANEYLKRAKALVDYALKAKMLKDANVWVGELFKTDIAEEDERQAYDDEDVKRLIAALCTKDLWRYSPAKPERFWIVLIALFHGLRLGNIVGLSKEDIVKLDNGLWCFKIRKGKTKATVRPVAICDALLLLGFLEWVEKLPRPKLFQDSSESFSSWYNRNEKRKDGYHVQGFEAKYVTADKKKCLYSLRHTYAGNVFEVTEDYKITADMMGHSTGGSVTARYIKTVNAKMLKAVSEQMNLDIIDLNRLETRAMELFGTDMGR